MNHLLRGLYLDVGDENLTQEYRAMAPARAELGWSPPRVLLITVLLNGGNWPERSLMFALFRAISVILGDK